MNIIASFSKRQNLYSIIQISMCKNFICLGSTDSETKRLDQKITLRISIASAAYRKLQEKTVKKSTCQYKVNRAVVLRKLLYGEETWTMY